MQSAQHRQVAAITDNLYIARQLLMYGLHLISDCASREPTSTSDAEGSPGISQVPSLRAFTLNNAARALQFARDIQPGTDLAKSIDSVMQMEAQDDDGIVAMVQAVENILAQLGADPKKSMFFGDFNYGDDKIALGDEVVGHEIGGVLYDRLPLFQGGGFEHEPDFIPRESFCTLSLEVALYARSLGGSDNPYQLLNPVRWNFQVTGQVPAATVSAAAPAPVAGQKQE
ncbi:MAG: hypothetical protein IPL73_24865 [Candidatus Obscuribacter sp.]|nr:hypothetical protein [Candidatus Obscuribacter sp.]